MKSRFLFVLLLGALCLESFGFTIPTGPTYPRQLYPSSRNTPLIISEILYHPPDLYSNAMEFVELYNTEPVAFPLGGLRLDGDIQFTFPSNTSLAPGSYLVVAANPSFITANYGLAGVYGPFTNRLNNSGGTLQLKNARGSVLLEVKFNDRSPWPAAADGAGHSLVLAQPDYGEGDPRAWRASAAIYGNPGHPDPSLGLPQQNVVINEVLTHTDLPQLDFVELFNYSTNSVNISGCWITDGSATNQYQIPTGTIIPAHGFAGFDENTLQFRLSKSGNKVWFINSNLTVVLDAVKFGAAANGFSFGHFPDGRGPLRVLSTVSLGATNRTPLIPSVVVNEILFHPISENDEDEYVELFNRSASAVDISYWRFTDGIDFTFAPGTSIAAGGFLVVAKSRTNLLAHYSYLNANPGRVVGDYGGSLDDGGETLTLSRPLDLAFPNIDFATVNSVTYGDGLDWGRWTDGDGSSLELTDPHSDNTLAMNWAGSDESGKAAWTNLEVTATLADCQFDPTTRLYAWLLDEGEALLDEVEVHVGAGANLVQNPGFNSNANGWAKWGNHTPSFWQSTNGYSGGCYHLRSQSAGYIIADKVIGTLTGSVSSNQTATIRAKVRWLAGSPNIALPLKGTGLELAGRMAIPQNLGTPGQPNSRLAPASNAGPAMADLEHTPILPAAGENVMVTCAADDPDGIASVKLFWRIDGAATYNSVTMRDDGAGGDVHPRDGKFSGTIPGQTSGSLVQFYVQAADATRTNTLPIPDPYYSIRGLVRFGETLQGGAFGNYRIWIRSNDVAGWDAETPSHTSNQEWPMTFVWHNFRAYHGAGIRFSGSANSRQFFSNPVNGTIAMYGLKLRDTERFLGERTFKMDHMDVHLYDMHTYQRSKLTVTLGDRIGAPVLYARYIHFFMNGTERGDLFTDAQTPDSDWIKAHFPDESDGYLHELQRYNEWDDNIENEGDTQRRAPFSYVTKPNGSYRKGTYRPLWDRKSNGPRDDDFSELFKLYDAMNATVNDAQVASFESTMDIDEFVLPLVMRHVSTDEDGMGYYDHSNALLYKPLGGKWKFIPWDFDTGWGALRSYNDPFPPTSNMNTRDPKLYSFWLRPVVQRAYWRSVVQGVNWLATDGVAHLNAWNAVLSASSNSVPVTDFSTLLTFVNNRVTFLRTAITNANLSPAFAITNNGGANFSTANYLLTLGGTAPVAVKQLSVNGSAKDVAVKWLDIRTWQFQIGLQPGANVITLTGLDVNGVQIASTSITVTYTGPAVSPIGNVVINELMVNPVGPGSEFIELYNRSLTQAYDLSGMKINGLSHTIRPGTIIQPNSFIVIAQNEAVWASIYGTAIIGKLAGDYEGRLDGNGETITLLMPDNVAVVDKVTYAGALPWPQAGWDGTGYSFQLIDPSKDNNQVWNWAAAAPTPGAANSVAAVLPALAQVFISEIQPNNGNTIQDNAGDYAPWIELLNPGSTVTLTNFFLTDDFSAPKKWAFPAGVTLTNGGRLLVWCDGEPTESSPPANLHTSFSLSSTGGVIALVQVSGTTTAMVSYVSYHAIAPDKSYGRYPNAADGYLAVFNTPTPRAANVATFVGALKINEWMASNGTTLADPADGHFDDWIELYNSSASSIDLTGYTLTDNFTNANNWKLPTGTTIPANGFLLVWADDDGGQPGLHASFKLSASGEEIALFAPDGQLVDHVVFGAQTADVSEGRYPNGGNSRYFMPTPTPLASNNVIPNTAPLQFGNFSLNSNQFIFTWPALSGQNYQVEYKEDLNSTNWIPLGDFLTTTDTFITVTNNLGDSTRRFFRLKIMP